MRLLLLAGTGEARRIAKALAEMPIDTVASLAGATQKPLDLAVQTRHGGFGGGEGFRAFLKTERISAVLDATHPFADRISLRSARICDEMAVPYAQLLRPGWVPEPEDTWRFFDAEEQAASFIAEGAIVFLGTGPQGLAKFANLTGRRVICRRIDPPQNPFPFPGGEYLLGRPPFSVEDEVALFRRLKVDWLVVKNSGGAASRSKLDAARVLGIPVALLNRPPQPDALRVETVEDALAWVRGLLT
ncbi:Cobalt-precorrin-6x reductase [Candidatus Rhodobacter oscarellae]|uniref:Cobalt-precorrin-6x reductase n=1 Tax=Candidatus Rhodobacter oscarellae TaxID=1675527 RepID=A0A0J9GVB8_9RHOB|nr:cobalt-precorrin-6A reductase [Candidatus Rhodobacter lobularis]KMW57518.1 Cobalt-precorrin-6x reductase [Candidatus Rhodobacter lobularis]